MLLNKGDILAAAALLPYSRLYSNRMRMLLARLAAPLLLPL